MPETFYEMGCASGRKTANACVAAIRKARYSGELPKLIGKKLDQIHQTYNKAEDGFCVNTESWSTGFFDGFYGRAEEL